MASWGGKRKGAGIKKKAVVTADQPSLRPIYSEGAIAAMIEFMRESSKKQRPRTMEWNPYVIRSDRFGPVVDHLKRNVGRSRRLAMDDNSALTSANAFAVNAWMSGGMMGDSVSEGLLFLGYSYLSELAQRPEYRLFGEIRAEEMTRNWIEFRGTDDDSVKEEDKTKQPNKDDEEADERRKASGEKSRTDDRNKEIEDKIKELNDFADHLKLKQWFKDVAVHDSHFGIGHMYLDLKGANIEDMRDPENRMSIGNGRNETSTEKLGKGCLLGLRTIEPVWCYPTTYNAANPLVPSWYDPQVWYVMGAEIHKTRLLPFISRPVPDILKPAYAFGGLSMSQMAKPYVDIWLRTRESVGELIHAFSVMILSTNMGTSTQPGGAGGGAGDVIARMMMANSLRDNQGMMVIDKMTEDFKNISAPISGLDELQAQAQEHLFSVGRIPAVKFAGIQPKGLNATSEGELRAFGETIHGAQEQLFRTPLTTISDIMQISLWGERDPDITFDFLPLQELTMKEKAEIRKIEAETDQIRIDSGVVSQEEVRKKVVADPESGYDGLDPDDVPDLLGEEEQGLIPDGSGSGLEAELGGGEGGPQADNDDEPAPKKKKKAAEGRDSAAVPFSGGRDEWKEGDHPRGQPGNAGQFGSGGGGKTKTPGEHPGIPDFLKRTAPGGSAKTGSGQKLKMPQFGLTPTPWESHQKGRGLFTGSSGALWEPKPRKPMPKSEGKPNAPGSVVAFTPGDAHGIKTLNGVPFKSFKPPADWADVEGQADIGEPPVPDMPKGMTLSSGCVIKEPDGRVWLMRPKNGFGGYDQTFPKGGVEEGLSPQANAIKEVFEETGLQVRITGFAGDYEGDVTVSRFYTAERVGGDPSDAGWEAEGVILAPADKLDGMLNRKRDRNIASSLASGQEKPALKPGDLEKVGKQMGTNEGGVFKDKNTGEEFYVKRLKTKDHVKSEMAAARLYQLAGVNTLTYREVEGGNHVATELKKLDKKNISDLSPAERTAATKDFAIHAWLSNWDAAGTGGDNQGVVGGKVTTLDVGGSLRYRAQGEPKGALFGNKVSEIDTMRDPNKSYDAAKLFGKMDMDEITGSVKRVASIPDAAIRTAVGDDKALADTLIARKKDIAKRFGVLAQDSKAEPEHRLTLEYDGDFNMKGLVQHLHRLGGIGASRTIKAVDENDDEVPFGWDGDGADKVWSAELDGEDILSKKAQAADAFEESKHPRGPDGKFAPKGGAVGGAKTWGEHIQNVINLPAKGGSHYRSAITEALEKAGPGEAKALKQKLADSWGITLAHYMKIGDTKNIDAISAKIAKLGGEVKKTTVPIKTGASMPPEYNPPQNYQQFKQHLKDAVSNKDSDTFNSLMKWNPEWAKQIKEEEGLAVAKPAAPTEAQIKAHEAHKAAHPEQYAPAPKPQQFPAPTEAELAKAQKNVPLQMQYVPGAKPELQGGEPMKSAQKLIDIFNEKYAGKTISDKPGLIQKVNDFKGIGLAINELAAKENEKKAEIAKEAQKSQMEAAKKAAAEAEAKKKAEADKFKKDHEEVTKELGLTSAQDLEAFDAFIEHFGGAANAISKFKSLQTQAQTAAKNNPGYGFEKLTGFEMGCIKAYTGPQSSWINQAIIEDIMTPAQHMFEKVLNSALDKLPKKTGLVKRGLSLDAKVLAKMKPGVIWTHRNFGSSNSKGWGGNTKLHITATGKGGAYVDPISSHQGEDETLFKSNLKLHISKVETINGITNVYCKEM